MYIPTPTAHGLQKQEYSRPGGQDRRDEILLGVHFLSLCLIGGKTGICNGQLGISVSILGSYAEPTEFYFQKNAFQFELIPNPFYMQLGKLTQFLYIT